MLDLIELEILNAFKLLAFSLIIVFLPSPTINEFDGTFIDVSIKYVPFLINTFLLLIPFLINHH